VKDLFLLIDHERGGLFGMKWAEPLIVLAGLFKGDMIRDDFQDAGTVPDL
jgi:hypothetical protein